MEIEVKKLQANIKFYTVMEYLALLIPLVTVIGAFIFYREPFIFLALIPTTIVALEFGNSKGKEQKKLSRLLGNQVED